MRIGYFGGSFDPPHRGHLALARSAAAAFGLERILVVPSANQPLKPEGADAAYADRLAMVALLCKACEPPPEMVPSQLESPVEGDAAHYTIETLRRLRDSLEAGDTVFVLVGADAFLDLRRWRKPEQLLEAAEWIVVSRPGFSLARLEELGLTLEQRSHVHLLETLEDTASATQIRAALAAGESCEGVLLPAVLGYIQAHGLYNT